MKISLPLLCLIHPIPIPVIGFLFILPEIFTNILVNKTYIIWGGGIKMFTLV